MNPDTQKIEELIRKVDELTKKVNDLYSSATFPLDVQIALTKKGFLFYDKTLIYEGGAGGNVFRGLVVKYKEDSDFISVGQKLIQFSVNTTSDLCYATNHNLSDGQTVSFYSTDTLPGGLDNTVLTYTIVNATTDTFQVDNGSGTVNITTNGTGVHFVQPY